MAGEYGGVSRDVNGARMSSLITRRVLPTAPLDALPAAPHDAPPEPPLEVVPDPSPETPVTAPGQPAKSRGSIVIHAEWQWGDLVSKRPGAGPDPAAPRDERRANLAPDRRRALRACALLAALAIALLVGSDLLLTWFPTTVRVATDGQALSVAVGGTTRAVPLARPIEAVRFPPSEPYRREFPVDGSDSTNNMTFNPEALAATANTPYYRFQAWLRDAPGYSAWRNLTIRDIDERRIVAQARPVEDTPQGVPPAFELEVDLRRIEIPRAIELRDRAASVIRVDINRNDKRVTVVRVDPDAPETQLARWYFSREWRPELAEVLYLIMRSCAVALLLALALVPVALLLPARVPLPTRRLTRALLLAGAVVVGFAVSVYTSVALFDKAPYIFDAQSYYFQAKTFAAGMLWAPMPPSELAFDVPFTIYRDGKWFSMYTPGAALVFALGVKVGVAWLVGPLLVVGGVLLTYAAASRQFGTRTALLAALLMASSPFLHLQAASFMSHTPGMFWGAALLYAAVRYDERRALRWAIAGAVALGFLFLTREMSAILYAATVGGFVAWRAGVATWRDPAQRWRRAGDVAALWPPAWRSSRGPICSTTGR